MNIHQIVNKFSLAPDNVLDIFIGKNVNTNIFNINNKIFFDVFYTYLIKNGWIIQNQYIQKTIQTKNIILECTLLNEISNILEFDVPFTSQSNLYRTTNTLIKKYKGTYYDIVCNHYSKQTINIDEFQKNIDSIYNERIEEITVFNKATNPFTINLNVEKISSLENAYITKIVFDNTVTNEDSINDLFEIIDLAMAKYKKTDKTFSSVFEYIY